MDEKSKEKEVIAEPIVLVREKFVIHVKTDPCIEYIRTRQKPLL